MKKAGNTQTLTDEIESGSRNAILKVNIIRHYIQNGKNTLAELGRSMDLSVPTVTKLVSELIEDGFVVDFGKLETSGGRRPNVYGVNPDSGYFMGVNVQKSQLDITLINFAGHVVVSDMGIPFQPALTVENVDELCRVIKHFMHKHTLPNQKIMSVGVVVPGRVNSESGCCFDFYFSENESFSNILHQKLGIPVIVENDSRSMAYGEFMGGIVKGEKDVLFVNISWQLGLGMIMGGKLYYGQSGISGEFGHMSVYDNEIICHCGKKGCLETQASGAYIHRRVLEMIADGNSSILQKKMEKVTELNLKDVIDAAIKGDMLCIEVVEEVGSELGKQIAGLINLFNPELVVIGGSVARTGDLLLFPIKSAVRKYALNFVSKDTVIKMSKLGESAGAVGACMLARRKMLSIG